MVGVQIEVPQPKEEQPRKELQRRRLINSWKRHSRQTLMMISLINGTSPMCKYYQILKYQYVDSINLPNKNEFANEMRKSEPTKKKTITSTNQMQLS